MKEKVWSMDITLVGTKESAGAVIWMCSINKVFWKIAENLQKNNEVSGLDICNLIKKWLMSLEFCKVLKNTYLKTAASESVRHQVYILLSECHLEEEKEYKIEDNPWMFQQVICTCEWRYYKINYKYERCKHTKTKSCYKNISCWFLWSFIFFIFSSF